MSKAKVYLGIDPGSAKTGLALAAEDGHILETLVIPTADVPKILPVKAARAEAVVLGDGTTSRRMQALLVQLLPGKSCFVVDERHSTEQARNLYWQLNPPRGWRRLLPLGMLVPPVPLDGYAAAILLQKFISSSLSQKA